MKKVILILVISFILMTSGCKPNPNYNPEINAINTMILNFKLDDYYGFEMITTQVDDHDQILNQETWIQHIDRQETLKIMTEISTSQLQPFNLDHMFVESNIVYYFYNNQKGTQVNDGDVVWEESTIESYQTFRFPLKRINTEYFKSYDITIDGDSTVLSAILNPDYTDNALGYTMNGLIDMSIELRFITAEKKITHLIIHFVFELTQIVIEMTPLTDPVQVIIPSV